MNVSEFVDIGARGVVSLAGVAGVLMLAAICLAGTARAAALVVNGCDLMGTIIRFTHINAKIPGGMKQFLRDHDDLVVEAEWWRKLMREAVTTMDTNTMASIRARAALSGQLNHKNDRMQG